LLLTRLANLVVWRIPGHAARKLFSFSLAEHGSMLDLALAARAAPDGERQAKYLRHMMDEARHARMFAIRSSEMRRDANEESFGFPLADNEDLFERLGETRFLAFVHRGEARGRRQFQTYQRVFEQRGDRKTQALFTAIVRDELRHEQYTRDLLVTLAGGESQARAELRLAALWEAWRTWRRVGRFMAERTYFVTMSLIYLCFGPIVRLASDRRSAGGWREAAGRSRPPRAASPRQPRTAPPRPGAAAPRGLSR
jgi:rubrerythrin